MTDLDPHDIARDPGAGNDMEDEAMTDLERWKLDGNANKWSMPSAVWWKRLPVIRRFRAAYHGMRAERHYQNWARATGALNSGYDRWIVWGIAHGMERPND